MQSSVRGVVHHWHLSRCIWLATQPVSSSQRCITYFNFDQGELDDPKAGNRFRPILKRQPRHYEKDRGGNVDSTERRALTTAEDQWAKECLQRLRSTKLIIRKASTDRVWNQPVVTDADSKSWYNAAMVRYTCKYAYLEKWRPSTEIQARKLCAEIKDPRYPKVYHSLEYQAHALYILGRCELERHPQWRPLAWFMLSISAGLGQLDAALLLHQLHKHDSRRPLQAEQRAVIAHAADTKLDWRAIVAHCEHAISTAKGRTGRGNLHGLELKHCLQQLVDAMSMMKPASVRTVGRESPPEGYLDVSTLEPLDPPYKLLLDLTANEISAGDNSEDMASMFTLAARSGAVDYRDPDAAWQYVQWVVASGGIRTEEWVDFARVAAEAGNADACFQLSKHCLDRDGWYRPLTAKTLDNTKRWQKEHRELRDEAEDAFIPETHSGANEERDAVMKGKDVQLLDRQDGLYWMKTSARLHANSATKMLNRYCIVAGLLRQNGFIAEGRQVLLEAQKQLQYCVGDAVGVNHAIRILNEYLAYWDKRQVHEILEPQVINELLNPPQKK